MIIFAPIMEEKEIKIVEGATKVFMQYGIKSVNMDDVAKHLGVSKKTLYVYVKDKEELVRKAFDMFCTIEDCQIAEIVSKKLPAIEESFEIMKWVLSILQNLHPSVVFDMEKYHPDVYNDMMQNRHKMIFSCMVDNMKKGQKEGMYRKDFDPEIVARLYMAHMEGMLNPRIMPFGLFNLSDVYKTSYRYHLHGIISLKGLEYLKENNKNFK